jgi:hypothetical protein
MRRQLPAYTPQQRLWPSQCLASTSGALLWHQSGPFLGHDTGQHDPTVLAPEHSLPHLHIYSTAITGRCVAHGPTQHRMHQLHAVSSTCIGVVAKLPSPTIPNLRGGGVQQRLPRDAAQRRGHIRQVRHQRRRTLLQPNQLLGAPRPLLVLQRGAGPDLAPHALWQHKVCTRRWITNQPCSCACSACMLVVLLYHGRMRAVLQVREDRLALL